MELLINDVKVCDSTVIEYRTNPKRIGKKAWARYEEYQDATTIGEYLELTESKFAKADLRYDHNKGFLTIIE
jgi:hypothetical protein